MMHPNRDDANDYENGMTEDGDEGKEDNMLRKRRKR